MSDYNVQVLVEPDACSGYGHYMEGYDGCHCNPGYIQDSNDTVFGMDVCIPDPDYEFTNVVFDEGSIENSGIIKKISFFYFLVFPHEL